MAEYQSVIGVIGLTLFAWLLSGAVVAIGTDAYAWWVLAACQPLLAGYTLFVFHVRRHYIATALGAVSVGLMCWVLFVT